MNELRDMNDSISSTGSPAFEYELGLAGYSSRRSQIRDPEGMLLQRSPQLRQNARQVLF